MKFIHKTEWTDGEFLPILKRVIREVKPALCQEYLSEWFPTLQVKIILAGENNNIVCCSDMDMILPVVLKAGRRLPYTITLTLRSHQGFPNPENKYYWLYYTTRLAAQRLGDAILGDNKLVASNRYKHLQYRKPGMYSNRLYLHTRPEGFRAFVGYHINKRNKK